MLHHHSGGGGHQNVATGTGGTAAASTFSLFFPPPPNSKAQWPPAEEAYYSYDDHSTVTTTSPSSPASSSSAGSVDCTLSLGTPSSRRGALDPDMARQGVPPQSLAWDATAVAESCYYQQQQGRPVAAAGVCRGAAGHEQLLDRRCANCGTASTPLWRNGPRGPKSLCNACGIRFKKEERRAAETGAGAGGCGFYGAQRAHGSAPIKAPRATSYAEEAQPCGGGDPDAPFLAWRLSAIPPAPAFSVWPDRATTMYQYN
uniref:Uncharacterized protein n=1 Tax=Avena sativa TaxID=4498 RepID=A0ACD5TZR4_AVESA